MPSGLSTPPFGLPLYSELEATGWFQAGGWSGISAILVALVLFLWCCSIPPRVCGLAVQVALLCSLLRDGWRVSPSPPSSLSPRGVLYPRESGRVGGRLERGRERDKERGH